jgi:uncharacterized protein
MLMDGRVSNPPVLRDLQEIAATHPYIHAMTENAPARANLCPICRQPTAEKFRPFCSRRCADVDLHRWLGGVYAVPVTEDTDEDGTPDEEKS